MYVNWFRISFIKDSSYKCSINNLLLVNHYQIIRTYITKKYHNKVYTTEKIRILQEQI